MKIDRLMAIIVTLLNRRRVQARELAKKFEVSVRTIYRDIDTINMAGIPIVSYAGNNGGFGIVDNYLIDRQVLTLKDMISLLSALKGIQKSFDDQKLDTAIEKIESLVPRERSPEVELLSQQIVMDVLPWGSNDKQKTILETIQYAVFNRQIIEIEYRNVKNEKVVRNVEPMTLIFKGYGWYLFAYCRLKDDYRLFRLSRIKSIQLMKHSFVRRSGSYRDIIHGVEEHSRLTSLVLLFSYEIQVLVEDSFPEEEITYGKEGIHVETVLPYDNWVIGWLLSFGKFVKVMSPQHVQNDLIQQIQEMTQIY